MYSSNLLKTKEEIFQKAQKEYEDYKKLCENNFNIITTYENVDFGIPDIYDYSGYYSYVFLEIVDREYFLIKTASMIGGKMVEEIRCAGSYCIYDY